MICRNLSLNCSYDFVWRWLWGGGDKIVENSRFLSIDMQILMTYKIKNRNWYHRENLLNDEEAPASILHTKRGKKEYSNDRKFLGKLHIPVPLFINLTIHYILLIQYLFIYYQCKRLTKTAYIAVVKFFFLFNLFSTWVDLPRICYTENCSWVICLTTLDWRSMRIENSFKMMLF